MDILIISIALALVIIFSFISANEISSYIFWRYIASFGASTTLVSFIFVIWQLLKIKKKSEVINKTMDKTQDILNSFNAAFEIPQITVLISHAILLFKTKELDSIQVFYNLIISRISDLTNAKFVKDNGFLEKLENHLVQLKKHRTNIVLEIENPVGNLQKPEMIDFLNEISDSLNQILGKYRQNYPIIETNTISQADK